jgi:hypothetical protein
MPYNERQILLELFSCHFPASSLPSEGRKQDACTLKPFLAHRGLVFEALELCSGAVQLLCEPCESGL